MWGIGVFMGQDLNVDCCKKWWGRASPYSSSNSAIPATAGIQFKSWTPAFAGVTNILLAALVEKIREWYYEQR